MKHLNIYFAYLDDHKDTYKIVVPAENKKDAEKYVAGNGDIIAIKEDTEYSIHTDRLSEDLQRCGWGRTEIDIICRALEKVGLDYQSRLAAGKARKI